MGSDSQLGDLEICLRLRGGWGGMGVGGRREEREKQKEREKEKRGRKGERGRERNSPRK